MRQVDRAASASDKADVDTVSGDAYRTFLGLLPDAALQVHLTSILSGLRPFLRNGSAWARETVRFIIVDKRDSLRDSFQFLPLLPELKAAHPDVVRVLTEEVQRRMGDKSVEDLFLQLIPLLGNESPLVAKSALAELRRVLRDRRHDVLNLVLTSDQGASTAPVIAQLVAKLLAVARFTHMDSVRKFCGDCLGELGAVDPSRLHNGLSGHPTRDAATKALQLDDRELGDLDLGVFFLSSYLPNLLRSARASSIMKNVAFACKDTLRFVAECLGFHAGSNSGGEAAPVSISADSDPSFMPPGLFNALAKVLPADALDAVRPYWNSKYELISLGSKPSGRVTPSAQYLPFFKPAVTEPNVWLVAWAKHLCLQSSGHQAMLFGALQRLMNVDPSLARRLLPYLVQNVVCLGGSVRVAEVRAEINAVLLAASPGGGGLLHPSSGGSVREPSGRDVSSAPTKSFGAAAAAGAAAMVVDFAANPGPSPPPPSAATAVGSAGGGGALSDAHQMATLTIFALMDQLRSWITTAKIALGGSPGDPASTGPSNVERLRQGRGGSGAAAGAASVVDKTLMESLLDSLEPRDQALAAFRVGANERALQDYEIHLRRRLDPQGKGMAAGAGFLPGQLPAYNVSELDFLLHIHSRLDDPDGVAGVTAVSALSQSLSSASGSGSGGRALAAASSFEAEEQLLTQGASARARVSSNSSLQSAVGGSLTARILEVRVGIAVFPLSPSPLLSPPFPPSTRL